MTIICGTDFSDNASRAAEVSAALAKRLNAPLKLVHVLDELGAELAVASEQSALYDPLRKRLRESASELASRFAIEVDPISKPGTAHDVVCEIARDAQASLIVVSSLGRKKQHRWLLGSVAERIAQSAPAPVLVVRDSASMLSWTRRERPLRVMVGVELGSTSKAALNWTKELRTLGPCDILVVEVTPAVGGGLLPGQQPHRDHDLVMDELRAWVPEIPGEGQVTLLVSPAAGPIDHHLTSFATQAEVDLLVVGTHQRSTTARLWQGSVSRGVLHNASCNVVSVPRAHAADEEAVIPMLRRVLVPTDLTALGNRAVPLAYSIVSAGGIVRLIHVASGAGSDDSGLKSRLHALIHKSALARDVATELDVLRTDDVAEAICRDADEFGADAMCMAMRASTGMPADDLRTNVAQQVLRKSKRPVLFVPDVSAT